MLVHEEGTVQRSVYYTDKLVKDAETKYTRIKKIILALLTSSQRLCPYFQAHMIAVLIDLPLRQILSKLELLGCLVKWSIELSEFDLQYHPRSTIKSQILADFITECTLLKEDSEVAQDPLLKGQSRSLCRKCHYGLYISMDLPRPWLATPGLFSFPRRTPPSNTLSSSFFLVINNEVEYEALIIDLKLAKELGTPALQVFSDSQLVVDQVNEESEARDPSMIKYLVKVQELLT